MLTILKLNISHFEAKTDHFDANIDNFPAEILISKIGWANYEIWVLGPKFYRMEAVLSFV